MTDHPVTPSPWDEWRQVTPARVALGRAGAGLPTDEVLRFGWAHAMARDAVHAALDLPALTAALTAQSWSVDTVTSEAPDRASYLRRPDLGRRLAERNRATLHARAGASCDIGIVIGDGLSALAVTRHAPPLLAALHLLLPQLRFAPVVVVATQARVALADEVASLLKARLAIMLIGERPGLSSPDSLGAYITHAPFTGRSDADRNCVSNIRPEGLGYEAAAFKLAWLARAALQHGLTGVALKDESDAALPGRERPAPGALAADPSA